MTYSEKIWKIINICKELFCLDHWDIYLRVTPAEYMEGVVGDGGGGDGYCLADYKYLSAKIDVSDDIEDEERLIRIVVHEMFHVALHQLCMQYNYMIEYVPEKARAREEQAWSMAEEATCQMISKGLSRATVLWDKELQDAEL